MCSNKNDKGFYNLGNQIKATQESLWRITVVVSGQLKTLEEVLIEIDSFPVILSKCNVL